MMRLKKKIGCSRSNLFVALSCLLISFRLFSQDSIVIGDEFKLNHSRTYFEGIAGKAKNQLIGVSVQYNKTKVNTLNIEEFNWNNLSKTGSYPIEFPNNKSFEITPEQIVLIGERKCIIALHHYKKKPIKVLALYEVVEDQLNEDYLLLDSLNNVGEDELEFYKITQNKDETKLIVVTNKLSSKRNAQRIEIKVINSDLMVEKFIEKDLPDIKKRMHFFDLAYTNDRLFLLSKNAISKGREISERVLKNNTFNLWCIGLSNDVIKQIELKLRDKWIVDLRVKPDRLNGCVIGGLYSQNSEYELDGTIAVEVDSSFNVSSHYLNEFATKSVGHFDREDQGLRQIRNLIFRDIKVISQGNYAFVMEEYFKDVEQYYDPQTETTALTDVFHYGSALVVWNNKTQWNEYVVEKNQISTNDGGIYSSFVSAVSKDNRLMLYYNDNDKNVQDSKDVKVARTGSFFIKTIAVSLNFEGQMNKSVLHKDLGLKLVPKNGFQLANNDVYLIFELNKRNQIARIK